MATPTRPFVGNPSRITNINSVIDARPRQRGLNPATGGKLVGEARVNPRKAKSPLGFISGF